MGEQQRERTWRRLRGLLQLFHLVGLRPIRSDGAFGCLPVDRRCPFHLAMNPVMAQITAEQQTFTERASFPQRTAGLPSVSGSFWSILGLWHSCGDLLGSSGNKETSSLSTAADKCVERPLKCYGPCLNGSLPRGGSAEPPQACVPALDPSARDPSSTEPGPARQAGRRCPPPSELRHDHGVIIFIYAFLTLKP